MRVLLAASVLLVAALALVASPVCAASAQLMRGNDAYWEDPGFLNDAGLDSGHGVVFHDEEPSQKEQGMEMDDFSTSAPPGSPARLSGAASRMRFRERRDDSAVDSAASAAAPEPQQQGGEMPWTRRQMQRLSKYRFRDAQRQQAEEPMFKQRSHEPALTTGPVDFDSQHLSTDEFVAFQQGASRAAAVEEDPFGGVADHAPYATPSRREIRHFSAPRFKEVLSQMEELVSDPRGTSAPTSNRIVHSVVSRPNVLPPENPPPVPKAGPPMPLPPVVLNPITSVKEPAEKAMEQHTESKMRFKLELADGHVIGAPRRTAQPDSSLLQTSSQVKTHAQARVYRYNPGSANAMISELAGRGAPKGQVSLVRLPPVAISEDQSQLDNPFRQFD